MGNYHGELYHWGFHVGMIINIIWEFFVGVSPMGIPCVYLELFGTHQGVFSWDDGFKNMIWMEWNMWEWILFPPRCLENLRLRKKKKMWREEWVFSCTVFWGVFWKIHHRGANVFSLPFHSWIRSIKDIFVLGFHTLHCPLRWEVVPATIIW